MMPTRHLLCFALALLPLAIWPSETRADESVFGFNYCPPPVVPSCIERSGKALNRREMDSCSRDVLRFTQTLGAYRTCLTRESERAVGTGNDAIARFRCLSQSAGSCGTEAARPQRKGNGNGLRSN